MHVATLRLELRVADGFRSRRRIVETVVHKIHRHFNVSVAEVDREVFGTSTVLGVAVVAPSRREAREILDRVADVVGVHPRLEVVNLLLVDL
jgi:uncharacterized protein YlxP (DUF503 family)